MGELGPTENLSWRELCCNDSNKTPYPKEWRTDRAIKLAATFESLRAELGGKPRRINSAYRTPLYNKKCGGAQHSQHVQGRAIDIRVPKSLHPKIQAWHARRSTGGLGLYNTFVHIDVRPGTRAFWDYRH